MKEVNLDLILQKLNNGDASYARDPQIKCDISNCALDLLIRNEWSEEDKHNADTILRISNIMYNNTSDTVLALDDGVYDQLIVKYQRYDPNYQVGAKPIHIEENSNNEIIDLQEMCILVPRSDDKHLFIDNIIANRAPEYRGIPMVYYVKDPISKRLINTEHKYPELVGTLDKCKFVTCKEAEEAGVLNNPDVQVFERDFIGKHIQMGILDPNEVFDVICELKYDGVSVEAEVRGNKIISAYSRGDTGDNIASDLTPIFEGYEFKYAKKMPDDIVFGIKFEAVITKRNLDIVSEIRGKDYKNARNAIIGILSATDAYRFRDYITLIPISTSMSDEMERVSELIFLNELYNSCEYNRFMHFSGNYMDIIYKVKQFRDSAEESRIALPYLIDGIVVSYTDKDKIAKLGRENSVNKYSIAIKFNPKVARTIFTGYTYSIGKTGDIIPMAHFKPCEFIGGIHTKQTIHSYQRFKELNLSIGQEVDITYRNDVITYLTKPDTDYNRAINNPVEFPTKCPVCGGPIAISDTGKSAKCININCPDRLVYRMTAFLETLNVSNFGEETIRTLGIKSIRDYLNITDVSSIGPNEGRLFIESRNNLISNPIPDYKIMTAMGYPGIGEEKFKTILREYTISELISSDKDNLANLLNISGIGQKIIDTIYEYNNIYRDDIVAVLDTFNIVYSKGLKAKPKVCLTGTRDNIISEALIANGYDIANGVSKDTVMLIAKDKNSNSTKIKKAKQLGITIYSIDEIVELLNIKL